MESTQLEYPKPAKKRWGWKLVGLCVVLIIACGATALLVNALWQSRFDDMKLAWIMATPLNVPIAFAAWSKSEFPELQQEMRSICDYSFDRPSDLEAFLFDEV